MSFVLPVHAPRTGRKAPILVPVLSRTGKNLTQGHIYSCDLGILDSVESRKEKTSTRNIGWSFLIGVVNWTCPGRTEFTTLLDAAIQHFKIPVLLD